MTEIKPGWYPDPADPTTQRYWDGEGWIGDPLPVDATPSPGAPETPSAAIAPPSHPAQGQPAPPAGQEPGEGGAPAEVPRSPVAQGPTAGTGPGAPPPPPASGSAEPPAAGWSPGRLPTVGPTGLPHVSAVVPRPHGLRLAPLTVRLVARVIDVIAVLLLNVAVNGWFVVQYVQEISPVIGEYWRRGLAGESTKELEVPPRAGYLEVAILAIALALWFAYEVPGTANNGQTLGKRLLRIKVVRVESLEPLGVRRAWRRWNPIGLPVLLWGCYGFGFLLQILDLMVAIADRPLRQAFHDKSAGTLVVKIAPLAPRTPDERREEKS